MQTIYTNTSCDSETQTKRITYPRKRVGDTEELQTFERENYNSQGIVRFEQEQVMLNEPCNGIIKQSKSSER